MKFLAVAIAASLAACAHQAAEQKSTQVATVTQAAPLSWYRLPGSEYSVLMPQGVKAGERDKTIPKGEVKINFAQAMPQGAAGNYFVSCAHFPDGALDPGASATILDQVQESTLREMGASPVFSKDITIDGMPGREFSARKGSEGNILGRTCRARCGRFAVSHRAAALAVAGVRRPRVQGRAAVRRDHRRYRSRGGPFDLPRPRSAASPRRHPSWPPSRSGRCARWIV